MAVSISLSHAQAAQPRRSFGAHALATLWRWRRNAQARKELRLLMERADDRMLEDVGLNRAILSDVSGRPFWKD